MRGVTHGKRTVHQYRQISTRTPHAGSDRIQGFATLGELISTRTPHAGSDRRKSRFRFDDYKFQPALPMRGVTGVVSASIDFLQFQPALPMRGVTPWCSSSSRPICDFNPHSPCGE